jgi:hypothetical protein
MYKSVDSFGDKYSTIPHLWKIIFSLLWAEKNISISVENHAPADRAIKAKGKGQKAKVYPPSSGWQACSGAKSVLPAIWGE